MENPIRGVTQDKYALTVIIIVVIVLIIVFFLAPKKNGNSPPKTPTAPETTSSQPSETLTNTSVIQSRPLMAESALGNSSDLDKSEDKTETEPESKSEPVATTEITKAKTETNVVDETEQSSTAPAKNPTNTAAPASSTLAQEKLSPTQIAIATDSEVKRLATSVLEKERVVKNLDTELKQVKQQLQKLHIELNQERQLTKKKTNETQLWQREAKQFEATMGKIIEDNHRETEMLSREVERWRDRALQAERDNASLRSRRPGTNTTLPAVPAAATRSTPKPLAQQPAPPPSQASPQRAPLSNFTTTCYDPNQGYFTCTVRQ